MKYDVHLYIACRVRFEDIEANSQAEAVKMAEEQFDPQNFFPDYHLADSREVPVWDESPALGALVDEHEDSEYSKTQYHDLAGGV